VVDLDRRKEMRRESDDMCHDHEARLRMLEKWQDQVIARLDRIEATGHATDRSVASLEDEMKNHTHVMRQYIDLSFSKHEQTEMKMHKDMLVQAIKATGGFIFVLVTAIATLGWWIFEHLVMAQ
jgi:hypothetical protein